MTPSASIFSVNLATFEADRVEASRSNGARADRLFDTKVQNSLRALRGGLICKVQGTALRWEVKFHDGSVYTPHQTEITALRRATGQPATKAVLRSPVFGYARGPKKGKQQYRHTRAAA